jgi:hypothetical protein
MPRPAEADARLLNGFPMRQSRLMAAMHVINTQWPKAWSPDLLVEMIQTGNRVAIDPRTARKELEAFDRNLPEVLSQISAMDLDPEVAHRALATLVDVSPRPAP